MKTIHEGYRWAMPGEVHAAACNVCGTTCTIRRNVLGSTCWAEAMSQRKKRHDAIECPHSGETWHNQAVDLQWAIEQMSSPRVAALMVEDLMDLVGAGLRGDTA